MNWHYQIVKVVPEKYEPYFCVKEVYIEGKKKAWTKNPIAPIGDSKKETIKVLKMMLNDAEHYPVMIEKENE